MSSFLIRRTEKRKKAIKIQIAKEGYDFKPNIKSQKIEINKITLFNKPMIDVILSNKLEKQFKRLVEIVYDVVNSDDENATADTVIALDEVARIREIILNKYQHFLDKEKEDMYIKRLRILENELRKKMVLLNNYVEDYEEKKGRGR